MSRFFKNLFGEKPKADGGLAASRVLSREKSTSIGSFVIDDDCLTEELDNVKLSSLWKQYVSLSTSGDETADALFEQIVALIRNFYFSRDIHSVESPSHVVVPNMSGHPLRLVETLCRRICTLLDASPQRSSAVSAATDAANNAAAAMFRPDAAHVLHLFPAAAATDTHTHREALLGKRAALKAHFEALSVLLAWPQNASNLRHAQHGEGGDTFCTYVLHCCGQFATKLVELADDVHVQHLRNEEDRVFALEMLLVLVRVISSSMLWAPDELLDLLPPQPWTRDETARIASNRAVQSPIASGFADETQALLPTLPASSPFNALRKELRADWAAAGCFHTLEGLLTVLLSLPSDTGTGTERDTQRDRYAQCPVLVLVLQAEILHVLAHALTQCPEAVGHGGGGGGGAAVFVELPISAVMTALLDDESSARGASSRRSAGAAKNSRKREVQKQEQEQDDYAVGVDADELDRGEGEDEDIESDKGEDEDIESGLSTSALDAVRIRMHLLCLRVNAALMRQQEQSLSLSLSQGADEARPGAPQGAEDDDGPYGLVFAQTAGLIAPAHVARCLVWLQCRFHACSALREPLCAIAAAANAADNAAPLLRLQFGKLVGAAATQHDLWPWALGAHAHAAQVQAQGAPGTAHDFHVLHKDGAGALAARLRREPGYVLWDAAVCELLGSQALSTARAPVNQGAKLSKTRLRYVFHVFRQAFADPLFTAENVPLRCESVPLGELKFVDFLSQLFKAAEAEDIFCVLREFEVFDLLLGDVFLCAQRALLSGGNSGGNSGGGRVNDVFEGATCAELADGQVLFSLRGVHCDSGAVGEADPRVADSRFAGLPAWLLLQNSVVDYFHGLAIYAIYFQSARRSGGGAESALLSHEDVMLLLARRVLRLIRDGNAPLAVYQLCKLLMSLNEIALSMSVSPDSGPGTGAEREGDRERRERERETRHALLGTLFAVAEAVARSGASQAFASSSSSSLSSSLSLAPSSLPTSGLPISGLPTSPSSSQAVVVNADAVFAQAACSACAELFTSLLGSAAASGSRDWLEVFLRDDSSRVVDLLAEFQRVGVAASSSKSGQIGGRRASSSAKYGSGGNAAMDGALSTRHGERERESDNNSSNKQGRLRGCVMSLLAMLLDERLYLASLQVTQALLVACAEETQFIDRSADAASDASRRVKQSLRALAAEAMNALLVFLAVSHKHARVKTSIALCVAALNSLIALLRDEQFAVLRITLQDFIRRENLLYEMLRALARCLNGFDVMKQRLRLNTGGGGAAGADGARLAAELEAQTACLMRAGLALLTAAVAGNDACKNVLGLLLQANREKVGSSARAKAAAMASSSPSRPSTSTPRVGGVSTPGVKGVSTPSSTPTRTPAPASTLSSTPVSKSVSGLTSIILCGERSPSKETVVVILDFILDGPHAGMYFLAERERERLRSGSSSGSGSGNGAMFSTDEDRPKICNFALLSDYFHLIPHCAEDVQLFVLDSFKNLVSGRGSLINLNVCATSRPKVLDIALDLFPHLPDRAQSSNAELVELLGRHSVSVASLKHLFRALQQQDGLKHPYSWKIIQALQGMFMHESGPKHTFVFDGSQSGLRLPTVYKWPSTRGFAFCCWLRVESPKQRLTQSEKDDVVAPGASLDELYKPFLLSLREPNGSGLELYLVKSTQLNGSGSGSGTFRVVLKNHSDSGETSTLTTSEEQQSGAQIEEDKWCFLGVSITANSFYNKGDALLVVNHTTTTAKEFSFTRLPEYAQPLIGECAREHALKMHTHTLRGQMGAMYLFSESVSEHALRGVCALGPDYVYNFEPSSADFKDVGHTNHTHHTYTPHTQSGSGSSSTTHTYTQHSTNKRSILEDGVLTSKILLTYNPVVLRGKYFLDNTPEKNEIKWRVPSSAAASLAEELRGESAKLCKMHAARLPGTHRSTIQVARLALNSLGGIKAILPLFAQLDGNSDVQDEKESERDREGKKEKNEQRDRESEKERNEEIEKNVERERDRECETETERETATTNATTAHKQNEANFFPAVLGLFTTLLEDSPENLRAFQRAGGFSTVRFLLDRAHPRNFNLITFNQFVALYLKLERDAALQDAVLENVLCNFKLWAPAQAEVQFFLLDWLVFTFRSSTSDRQAAVFPQAALGVQRLVDALYQFYDYSAAALPVLQQQQSNQCAPAAPGAAPDASPSVGGGAAEGALLGAGASSSGKIVPPTQTPTHTFSHTHALPRLCTAGPAAVEALRLKVFALLKVSLRHRALPEDVLSLLRYLVFAATDTAKREVLVFLIDALQDRELRDRWPALLLGFLCGDALYLLQSVAQSAAVGHGVKLLVLQLFGVLLWQLRTHWAALAMLYIQFAAEGSGAISAAPPGAPPTLSPSSARAASRAHCGSAGEDSLAAEIDRSLSLSQKSSGAAGRKTATPRPAPASPRAGATGGAGRGSGQLAPVTSPADFMHNSGLMQRGAALLNAALDALLATCDESGSVCGVSQVALFGALQDMLVGAYPEALLGALRGALGLSEARLPSPAKPLLRTHTTHTTHSHNAHTTMAFPFVYFVLLRACCKTTVRDALRDEALSFLLCALRPFAVEQALGVEGWQDALAAALRSLLCVRERGAQRSLTSMSENTVSCTETATQRSLTTSGGLDGSEPTETHAETHTEPRPAAQTVLLILDAFVQYAVRLGRTKDLQHAVSPEALRIPRDAQLEIHSRIARGERIAGMSAVRDLARAISSMQPLLVQPMLSQPQQPLQESLFQPQKEMPLSQQQQSLCSPQEVPLPQELQGETPQTTQESGGGGGSDCGDSEAVADKALRLALLWRVAACGLGAVRALHSEFVAAPPSDAYDPAEFAFVHRRNVWLAGLVLGELLDEMDRDTPFERETETQAQRDSDKETERDTESETQGVAALRVECWAHTVALFAAPRGTLSVSLSLSRSLSRLRLVGALVRIFVGFSTTFPNDLALPSLLSLSVLQQRESAHTPHTQHTLTTLLHNERLLAIGGAAWLSPQLLLRLAAMALRHRCAAEEVLATLCLVSRLLRERDRERESGASSAFSSSSSLCVFEKIHFCAFVSLAATAAPHLLGSAPWWERVRSEVVAYLQRYKYELLFLARPVAERVLSLDRERDREIDKERKTLRGSQSEAECEREAQTQNVSERDPHSEREKENERERAAAEDAVLDITARLLDGHIAAAQCRSFRRYPSRRFSRKGRIAAQGERQTETEKEKECDDNEDDPDDPNGTIQRLFGGRNTAAAQSAVCAALSVDSLLLHSGNGSGNGSGTSEGAVSAARLWHALCAFVVRFSLFAENVLRPLRAAELGLDTSEAEEEEEEEGEETEREEDKETERNREGESENEKERERERSGSNAAIANAAAAMVANDALLTAMESESQRLLEHWRAVRLSARRAELRWSRLLSQLANERGPWGYGADSRREVFWMLDAMQNDKHCAMRLRRNAVGTRHVIASLKSNGIDGAREQAAALSCIEDSLSLSLSTPSSTLSTSSSSTPSSSSSGIYADLKKYRKRIAPTAVESGTGGESGGGSAASNAANNSGISAALLDDGEGLSDNEDELQQPNGADNTTATSSAVPLTESSESLSLSVPVEVITPASNSSGGKTSGRLELSRHRVSFLRSVETKDFDFVNKTGNAEFLWACECFPSSSWTTSDVVGVYRRHYQTRYVALEIFFTNRTALFLNCGEKSTAKKAYRFLLYKAKCPQMNNLFTGKPSLAMSRALCPGTGMTLTAAWEARKISNFEYLMYLNFVAGRTFQDLAQYPVFPWVLADYSSSKIDLKDPRVYRRFDRPMAAQLDSQHETLREKYASCESLQDDGVFPYHTGSHYSTSAMVIWYLLRMEPFTSYHVWLQDGKFDRPDRLFHSIEHCFAGCTSNPQDVKELVPEFFFNPEFLFNTNGCEFGKRQCGEYIGDVTLPRWCKDATEFIRINRDALESEYVSTHLHQWIDLVFGAKQRPPFLPNGSMRAVDALNVFVHLSYADAVDLDAMKRSDPALYHRTLRQIDSYGQTPAQLFTKEHPRRRALLEAQDLIWPIGSVVLGADTIPRNTYYNSNNNALALTASSESAKKNGSGTTGADDSSAGGAPGAATGATTGAVLEKPARVLCYGEFRVSSAPVVFLCELNGAERLLSVDSGRVLGAHSFVARQPDNVPPFSLKPDRAALLQSCAGNNNGAGGAATGAAGSAGGGANSGAGGGASGGAPKGALSLSLARALPGLPSYGGVKEKTVGIPFAAAVVLSGSAVSERAGDLDLEALGTKENRIKYLAEETRSGSGASSGARGAVAGAATSPGAQSGRSGAAQSGRLSKIPSSASFSLSPHTHTQLSHTATSLSQRGGARDESLSQSLSLSTSSLSLASLDAFSASAKSVSTPSNGFSNGSISSVAGRGRENAVESERDTHSLSHGKTAASSATTHTATKRDRADEHLSPNLFCVIPSHKLLVSAGHWDNTFKVSAADTGRLLQSLSHHREVVTCVATTSDFGKHWVVAGSKDCTLTVWELFPERDRDRERDRERDGGTSGTSGGLSGQSGGGTSGGSGSGELFSLTPSCTLYGHDDGVNCVAALAELDLVVSGSDDGTLIVHTLRDGAYIRSIAFGVPSSVSVNMHNAAAATAAAALARGGSGSAAVAALPLVGNATSGSPRGTTTTSSLSSSLPSSLDKLRRVHGVLISREGYLLAYSNDGHVLATYTLNGRYLRMIHVRERLYALTLSEDGRVVFTGGERGLVVLRWVHNLTIADTGPRRGLEAVLDGSNDGEFAPIGSPIRSMVLTANERHLIVGLESGEIRVLAQDSEYLRRKLHRRLMEIGILSM